MADTIVDIPGVGHVAFPDGMSHDQIGEAIRTKILPQAQSRAQPVADAPVGPMRPTPQAPLNPAATPGAPDYGGPGGTQRPWFEQPVTQEPNPMMIGGSSMTDVGRAANLDARSVGRGLANTAGLPVDLATGGYNSIGAIINKIAQTVGLADKPVVQPVVNPPGGSQMIQEGGARLAGAAGLSAVTPTEKEKLGGDVIEGVTSAVTPGAMMFKAASTASKLGVPSERMNALIRPYGQSIETADRMVADPITKTAAAMRPLMVDAAAGAGAGVGQNAAEQYAPDSPLAKLVASIAGGFGGATGVSMATAPANVLKSVRDWMTVDPTTKSSTRVADLAAERLQGAALDPEKAAANIGTKMNEYADQGMTLPTSGVLSEDPALISIERGLRSNAADPKVSGSFGARDQRVRSSMAEKLDEVGDKTADTRTATNFANDTAGAARAKAQDEVATAQAGVDAAAKEAGDLGGVIAANKGGETGASINIDKAVRGTLDEQRGTKNELYAEAKTAGAEVPRDVTPFQTAADEVRAAASTLAPESSILPKDFLSKIDEATKSAAPQKVETGLLDAEGKPIVREQPGENPSYRDIAGLRPALSDAIAKARAENQGAMVESLSKLKAEVENESTRIAADAAKPGADPKVVALNDKIAAAEKNYKETYAPNFVKGEGGKLRQDIARDSTGTATKPEDTAKRFLTSKEGSEDLARIVSIAKNPAEAKQAVSDWMHAQIAKVSPGEKPNEQAIAAWMTKNKNILAAHPEAAKEVRDLYARVQTNKFEGSAAQGRLEKAQAGVKLTEDELGKNGLKLALDKDPHTAVDSVMSSGDPRKAMKDITATMGGKDAKTSTAVSWKRAVSDWVAEKVHNENPGATDTGVNPVSLAKLGKTSARYDEALSEVFNPGEMNALQTVRKVGTDLSRINSVRATSGSNTAEDVKAGLNVFEMVAKGHLGQLRGGGVTRTAKLVLGNLGLMNEGVAVGDVLARAMHDPSLALHLLERPTSKLDRSLWNKKLNALLGAASTQREE